MTSAFTGFQADLHSVKIKPRQTEDRFRQNLLHENRDDFGWFPPSFFGLAGVMTSEGDDSTEWMKPLNPMGLTCVRGCVNAQGPKFAEDTWQQVRAFEDRREEFTVLCGLGAACLQSGKLGSALNYCLQALKGFQDLGCAVDVARTLDWLIQIYSGLGEWAQALLYARRALKIWQTLEDSIERQQGEGITLHALGVAYHRLGQCHQALDCFDRALTLRHQIGDRLGIAATLEGMGTTCVKLDRKPQALDRYQEAREIYVNLQDYASEARLLDFIGAVYYKLDRIPRALWYHFQSEGILQMIAADDHSSLKTLLERDTEHLSSIYRELGLSDRASDCTRQLREIGRTLGKNTTEQAIEDYLGLGE